MEFCIEENILNILTLFNARCIDSFSLSSTVYTVEVIPRHSYIARKYRLTILQRWAMEYLLWYFILQFIVETDPPPQGVRKDSQAGAH